MQAFTALTIKGDAVITENVIDELVHCRLLERAALACRARKCRRALDLFRQEIVDVCRG